MTTAPLACYEPLADGFSLSRLVEIKRGLSPIVRGKYTLTTAKLQNAAASIDKLGAENLVIRTAFVFSILLTVVTSLFLVLLLAIN